MSRHLVVDACALVNLLATGREVELTVALDAVLVSSAQARAEALFLCGPPAPDDEEQRATRIPVDLAPLLETGRFSVRVLGDDMADAFVLCATHLRDADASAVALAASLAVPLVSDDGRVQKVARTLYPGLVVLSTLQLVREAAARAGIEGEPLRQLARSLHERGNFDPPRRDPERSWYEDLLAREGAEGFGGGQ